MDWASIFIHDTTWAFAAEISVRAILMFSMIIIFLRLTGKRGVRQLSIFELAIILSLGSIAGDPMFTEDLPLIQAPKPELPASFEFGMPSPQCDKARAAHGLPALTQADWDSCVGD